MTTDVHRRTETPYAVFRAEVSALRRISPRVLEVTFRDDDLADFADLGLDTRIKLVFPDGRPLPQLPEEEGWYAAWRALPEELRNPIRTYTVRRARPLLREIDVQIVLHEEETSGPASRWALSARIGDRLLVVGPNARYEGPIGGTEWKPPAGRPFLLLGGDETALPAIGSILESLAPDACGLAVVEIPTDADRQPLRTPPGVRVVWQPRDGREHGSCLEEYLRANAAEVLAPARRPLASAEDDEAEVVDQFELPWDVPQTPAGTADVYAWLAGESGTIKRLRRHLVRDLGIDRRAVAFMGYWKCGAAEAN